MGQNQLLFIVLSVIIVGTTVAVGVQQMGENAKISNRDAIAADAARTISNAQQWYRKPVALGGGGNSWTGITLGGIGVSGTNQNGTIATPTSSGTELTVVVTGTELNEAGDPIEVTMTYDASNDSMSYSDNMP